MAGDTIITVIGNITGDPELRFTPSGAAVSNFTVASTPRKFNRQTNAWDDGETLFMRCSVWRDAAENVAESLQRGTRVIVSGRLTSRSYETKEGEKRTVIEMEVDEVGPSLRYATAKVNKTERQQGGGGFNQQQQQEFGGQAQASRQMQQQQQGQPDPWAQGPQGGQPQQQGWGQPQGQPQQQQGWGGQQGAPSYDEPPF